MQPRRRKASPDLALPFHQAASLGDIVGNPRPGQWNEMFQMPINGKLAPRPRTCTLHRGRGHYPVCPDPRMDIWLRLRYGIKLPHIPCSTENRAHAVCTKVVLGRPDVIMPRVEQDETSKCSPKSSLIYRQRASRGRHRLLKICWDTSTSRGGRNIGVAVISIQRFKQHNPEKLSRNACWLLWLIRALLPACSPPHRNERLPNRPTSYASGWALSGKRKQPRHCREGGYIHAEKPHLLVGCFPEMPCSVSLKKKKPRLKIALLSSQSSSEDSPRISPSCSSKRPSRDDFTSY